MAKAHSTPCLCEARKAEIREAFLHWYEPLERKLDSMRALGVKEDSLKGFVSSFRSGVRTPPPWLLAALWQQTQDVRFLFTKEEKALKLAQRRKDGLPSPEEWPDKESKPTTGNDPPPPEITTEAVPLSKLLLGHGGETSPLGVKGVLGVGSFVQIDLDPSKELIVTVERLIQTLRGLLNLLAQIRDDHTRTLVRKRIGPQIEELELAIRMFSDVHPNRLTQLHDDQRRAWAGNGSGNKQSKETP